MDKSRDMATTSQPPAPHRPLVMNYRTLNTQCFIPLDKLPLMDTCRQYKINYDLLCKDYDLNVANNESLVTTSSSTPDRPSATTFTSHMATFTADGDYSVATNDLDATFDEDNTDDQSFVNQRPDGNDDTDWEDNDQSSPYIPKIGKRKKKRSDIKQSSSRRSHKRLKYNHNESVANSSASKAGKGRQKSKAAKKHFTDSSANRVTPSQPSKKRRTTQPNRWPDNHMTEFLGERWRTNDLLYKHCECENDCEPDELSLAFHVLCVLSDTNDPQPLPRHLDIAVNGHNNSNGDDDVSDFSGTGSECLADVLPPEEDIYKQTICDDFLDSSVNDFMKNTFQTVSPGATVPTAVATSAGPSSVASTSTATATVSRPPTATVFSADDILNTSFIDHMTPDLLLNSNTTLPDLTGDLSDVLQDLGIDMPIELDTPR